MRSVTAIAHCIASPLGHENPARDLFPRSQVRAPSGALPLTAPPRRRGLLPWEPCHENPAMRTLHILACDLSPPLAGGGPKHIPKVPTFTVLGSLGSKQKHSFYLRNPLTELLQLMTMTTVLAGETVKGAWGWPRIAFSEQRFCVRQLLYEHILSDSFYTLWWPGQESEANLPARRNPKAQCIVLREAKVYENSMNIYERLNPHRLRAWRPFLQFRFRAWQGHQ